MKLTIEQLKEVHREFSAAAILLNAEDTADDVAFLLNSLGIKGRQHICGSCPVSEYFIMKLSNFPAGYQIRVMSSTMAILIFVGNENFEVEPSVAVNEFIRKFDRGFYPYLEKR